MTAVGEVREGRYEQRYRKDMRVLDKCTKSGGSFNRVYIFHERPHGTLFLLHHPVTEQHVCLSVHPLRHRCVMSGTKVFVSGLACESTRTEMRIEVAGLCIVFHIETSYRTFFWHTLPQKKCVTLSSYDIITRHVCSAVHPSVLIR
jgi:hypothetical protein